MAEQYIRTSAGTATKPGLLLTRNRSLDRGMPMVAERPKVWGQCKGSKDSIQLRSAKNFHNQLYFLPFTPNNTIMLPTVHTQRHQLRLQRQQDRHPRRKLQGRILGKA